MPHRMRAAVAAALLVVAAFAMHQPAANAAGDAVQVVSVTDCTTGVNLIFYFNGNGTSYLPCTASAGEIQFALQGLPGVGGGNVAVNGTTSVGAYTLTVSFLNALAGRDVGISGGVVAPVNSAIVTVNQGGPDLAVSIVPPPMQIIGGSVPAGSGYGIITVSGGNLTELDRVSGCGAGGLYSTTNNGNILVYDSRVGVTISPAFAAAFPGGVVPQATSFLVSCAP